MSIFIRYGDKTEEVTMEPCRLDTGGASNISFKEVIERTATEPALPADLTSIGSSAFYYYGKLALTYIPNNVESINGQAFYNCTNLALKSLPVKLTFIGDRAFYNCTKLAIEAIPTKVTDIGNSAFYGCVNIKTLTFKGTPTTIQTNAFGGCTGLTQINVPWAEGAVEGAPWGATKATITYNYTGE